MAARLLRPLVVGGAAAAVAASVGVSAAATTHPASAVAATAPPPAGAPSTPIPSPAAAPVAAAAAAGGEAPSVAAAAEAASVGAATIGAAAAAAGAYDGVSLSDGPAMRTAWEVAVRLWRTALVEAWPSSPEPTTGTTKEGQQRRRAESLARPRSQDAVRLVSWNVHKGLDVRMRNTRDRIQEVILSLEPDVVVLQEAYGAITADCVPPSQHGYRILHHDTKHGLLIAVKQAAVDAAGTWTGVYVMPESVRSQVLPAGNQTERRAAASVRVCAAGGSRAPSEAASVEVVTTHLDVWDETEGTRVEQLVALLDTFVSSVAATKARTVVAGDFNLVRRDDHPPELFARLRNAQGQSVLTRAWDEAVAPRGWDDTLRSPLSVWTGRRVDFALRHRPGLGPNAGGSQLVIERQEFIPTALSDHLPLLVDVSLYPAADTQSQGP